MENQKLVRILFERNGTVQKFVIRSEGFPTETVCNPQFKLKVTKINLFAFNVQIKNVLKHDRNRV